MEDSYERLLRAARELGKADNPAEVARLLGVSDQTIQNWKTRGVPDSKLIKIEEKIGALPAWIATGKGDMLRKPQVNESSLTEEQKYVLLLMQGIRKEARETWIKMGGHLSEHMPERRKEDIDHQPERRRHFGIIDGKRVPKPENQKPRRDKDNDG